VEDTPFYKKDRSNSRITELIACIDSMTKPEALLSIRSPLEQPGRKKDIRDLLCSSVLLDNSQQLVVVVDDQPVSIRSRGSGKKF